MMVSLLLSSSILGWATYTAIRIGSYGLAIALVGAWLQLMHMAMHYV